VLEWSCSRHTGRLFQFLYQLPSIQGIHKINIPRTSIQTRKLNWFISLCLSNYKNLNKKITFDIKLSQIKVSMYLE
jgi:hypothetical protein